MHHKMSHIHKKCLSTPTHQLTTLPLSSLLSVEQGYSTSPWSKQFMAITLGSLWYDHLYNLTVPSHWGYLTWQMNCVLTEMGSVCPCHSVYRLVCRGEGGPVSSRRRLCITVCHPLGLWYTRTRSHTCTDMHFIINMQSKKLLYSLYISDLYMRLHAKYFSIGLGLLPAAFFHCLCLHSHYMFILTSSSTEALTHLWSGLIVSTHSFKCFQFSCRQKQESFKIVSLCFSREYLAALQLNSMFLCCW